MYNKGTIIAGLAIFVLFVTFPIWYNGLDAGPLPKPELPPGGEKLCVAPASEMRDTHMQLLNEWRDEVLRTGNREYINDVEGIKPNTIQKGLQIACLKCHTSKKKFCDKCHEYASVKPYCWDCHLEPVE